MSRKKLLQTNTMSEDYVNTTTEIMQHYVSMPNTLKRKCKRDI